MTDRTALPARLPADGTAIAVGFSPWKRPLVRRLCRGCRLRFADGRFRLASLRLAYPGARQALVWSFRDEELGIRPGQLAGLDVIRVEDGFLRSRGRGLDKTLPFSLVCDRAGLYFDGARPSDLETMLETGAGPAVPEDEARAALEAFLAAGVSKYNPAGAAAALPERRPGTALVLGQVADDRSISRNRNAVADVAALVREAEADPAVNRVVFRQHPDCLAGGGLARPGRLDLSAFPGVRESDPALPFAAALAEADVVYTISSLGGFEAALRGRRVVTYGQPFYAGWGFTEDRAAFPRRTRRLTPLQVFAAAYLAYPFYFDPRTGEALAFADVLERLSGDAPA